jgi:mannose-6-phosphate isomerase-like protein (cupin superfamily)
MNMDRTTIAKMSPEEKEAFHREAEARMQPLGYTRPESGKPKDIVPLAKSSRLRTAVQIVHEGGENNLHYHTNSDTCWFVLRGRVRFYGVGDTLIGEYGPREGIQIPEGSRYWFEKTGDEDLELLQVVGLGSEGKAERINLEQHKEWMASDAYLTTYEK